MLERVVSMRRAAPNSGDGADSDTDDESKAKRTHRLSVIAARFTNHVAKLTHVCPWPCFVLCAVVIFLIPSVIHHTRNLVCISNDAVSRARFFGFDGLESDFGVLGVPWCKSLSYPIFFSISSDPKWGSRSADYSLLHFKICCCNCRNVIMIVQHLHSI